jgi:hypothetical protein
MEGLNERQESMREVNAFLKRQQPRKKTVKISPEHRSKYMESRARLSEQMKGVPQSEETKRCLASFLLTSFLNAWLLTVLRKEGGFGGLGQSNWESTSLIPFPI